MRQALVKQIERRALAAASELAVLEEAIVVAHDEVGLDLAERIEGNADDNEQRGAAEEPREQIRDAKLRREDCRNDGDDAKANRADERYASHGEVEKFGGRHARTDTGDVAIATLQVVRNAHGMKLGGDPEEREENNQNRVEDEVDAAIAHFQGIAEAFEPAQPREINIDAAKEPAEGLKNGARKDDRHNARIIDAQGHVGILATRGAVANGAAGGVDRNTAKPLGQGDGGGKDTKG